MNIYEKLQAARIKLKDANLKKSGRNRTFEYYELEDILPTIQSVCAENRILPVVSFTKEQAELKIFDIEKEGVCLSFTSPMVDSPLQGMNGVQSLGANETYQRRYLYLTAFEIVERDANDGNFNDTNSHDIFIIKKRIEELLTLKIQNSGVTKVELLKKLGLTEKDMTTYFGYFERLNKLEQAIKGL